MYSGGYVSRRQLNSISVSALDSSGLKLKSGICVFGETALAFVRCCTFQLNIVCSPVTCAKFSSSGFRSPS